jgi:N,N'-diacetylchitobiose transport system substrate-binding protein
MMSTFRKRHALVAASAAAALVLVACGGDDGDDGTTDDAATDDSGAEAPAELSGDLEVWVMEPGADVLETLEGTATAFEAEHEGVEINLESIPWDGGHDQFVAAISAGEVPDLAELGNTWLLEFAALDALAPVEWPADEELVSGLADSALLDGTAYGYPWYAGVRALIYRTDVFEEAGVDVPETWADVLEVGDTIAAEVEDIAPIRAAGGYQHMYQPLIWGTGGDLATLDGDTWTPGFNTDEGKEALEFFNTLWEKDWSPEGAVQWNSLDVREDFANEGAAMMVGGGWDLTAILGANPDLEGKLGTALLPAGSTGNRDSFAGGSHLGVFSESDQQDLAKAFGEFMISTEEVSEFAGQIGFLPGTVAGVEQVLGDDELYGTFGEQYLEHSRFYPVADWWGAAEGAAVIPNTIQSMMLGDITVDEAAANIDAGLQDVID